MVEEGTYIIGIWINIVEFLPFLFIMNPNTNTTSRTTVRTKVVSRTCSVNPQNHPTTIRDIGTFVIVPTKIWFLVLIVGWWWSTGSWIAFVVSGTWFGTCIVRRHVLLGVTISKLQKLRKTIPWEIIVFPVNKLIFRKYSLKWKYTF